MMCTTDHTFANPRDCLDHLMSVNVTARLKVLRGGVSVRPINELTIVEL